MVVAYVALAYGKKPIPSGNAFLQIPWLLILAIVVLVALSLMLWFCRKKSVALQLLLTLSTVFVLGGMFCIVLIQFLGFSRSDALTLAGILTGIIGIIVGVITPYLIWRASPPPPPPPPGDTKLVITPDRGLIRYIKGDKKAASLASALKNELKSYIFDDRVPLPRDLGSFVAEMEKDLREATYIFLVFSVRRLEKLGRPRATGDAFSRWSAEVQSHRLTLLAIGEDEGKFMSYIRRFSPILVNREKTMDYIERFDPILVNDKNISALLSRLIDNIEKAREQNAQLKDNPRR